MISLMTGCAIYEPKFIHIPAAVNFSPYTADGFFITTANSVSFDYAPVGYVSVDEYSGFEKRIANNKVKEDGIYDKSEKWTWREAATSTVLNELVKEAKMQGANGLMDLKIENIVSYQKDRIKIIGIKASGMAFKK